MFWMTGILGLAQGLAPFVLGFSDHTVARWTSMISGTIIVIFSVIGLTSSARYRRWIHWAIGLTCIAAFVASLISGYSDHTQPLRTALLWGAVLALLDAIQTRRPIPDSRNR